MRATLASDWPGVLRGDFLEEARPGSEPSSGRSLQIGLSTLDAQPPIVNDSAALRAALEDSVVPFASLTPRPHGQIRPLRLAPPAHMVGASATFVADASGRSSPFGSDIEIRTLDAQSRRAGIPDRAGPPLPGVVAPSPASPVRSGDATTSPGSATSVAAPDSSTAPSTDSSSVSPATAGQASSLPNDGPRSWQAGSLPFNSASLPSDAADASPAQSGAAAVFGPPGKNCSVGGPPGQGGALGQSGGGPNQFAAPQLTPSGPPCIPPGQQTSSIPDPLYVLNWHEGLVMFPNVIEFDQPADYVELRAPVYGATVQSYSWNTSQASRLGCATGASTYKLQFRWTVYSPIETTEQITITATMTDQTTQQQTLTFKLAPGNFAQCPGSGGSFPTTTWPAVLTPDKPLEQGSGFRVQGSGIFSDSATRPYAVSQASGILYVGHGLPGYNPGVPALGLTYSSIAAERRPIFINRYELNPSAAVPNTVSARLQFNGVWGPSKFYDTSPSTTKHNPGNVLQISLQADAGTLPTGRYNYTFETTANYGGSGGSSTTTNSGTVTIINEESSPFGEGWTLGTGVSGQESGVSGNLFNRLHVVTGGVILNQGAGNSLWFASSGPNTFTTPPGDFSTLVKNFDNTYTRTLKDGIKQNFNVAGMQTSLVDRNNNTLAFAYIDADSDGLFDELSTITDANGLVTALAYPGTCGAGVSPARACTITDPAGRVTAHQYNSSGQLIRITDPDNAAWQFSYDTASGRMTGLPDPRSNTTSVAYNFAGRVTTITRPDSTTEQFRALQLQSLCDSGQCTQASPGTPLLSAEAVADYTDPRGNAWDSRMDWTGFGVTTQLTDPLGQSAPAGHMAVYHRDGNGLVSQDTDRLSRDTRYARDSKGNPTTITLPDRTTQQYQYNGFSQVTVAIDELGRQTAYTYDVKGNLTQVTEPDPDGGGPLTSPITALAYDSQGNLTQVTDPRGKVTTVTVDTRDRITQVKYPDDDGDPGNNPTQSFVYDTASNVTSQTNERGYTTTATFDAMGRPLSETDPLNHTTSYVFDGAGNVTRVSNALNQSTDFGYNNMNRRVTITDALGNVTNVTYDNDGNITQVKDPINRTTTRGFNQLAQHTSTTTPLNNATNYTRDAEAQTTGVTDPLNNTNTSAYSNRGWTTSTTDPLNNTVSMGYDSSGNMTSQNHSGGGKSFQHDGLDQLTRFTNELSSNTDYSYDSVGNLTSVKDALNHTDTLTYDPRNRLITATNALNNSTQFLWDAASNLTRITDPLSRATNRAFDAADRLTSITLPDPDGGGPLGNPVISFGHDNADRLTSITDPVNNATSWTIDAAGRVTGDTNPLGSRAYVYNAASELTRVTDRNGRVREFVYDADGRRTQEKWLDGGGAVIRTISYQYDSNGRLTNSSDPDFQYTFTHDADSRLTSISNSGTPNMPQVTLTNTYDGNDNRTGLSDNLSPAGSMSFSYDAAERMTAASLSVSGSTVAQITLGYDAASRLTLVSRRTTGTDKTDTSHTYDDADRLTGITHQFIPSTGGSTTLATYSYSYNAANEVTTQTNSDGTLNYGYDGNGQLITVTGAFSESYSYDVNGNRTMSGYTTGTANRLTSDGVYNYTYDNEGNLTVKSQITNGQRSESTWDYRNRPTQVLVCTPGAGGACAGGTVLKQANYVYDVFNRRIGATVDSDGSGPAAPTTRWTMYDGVGLGAPAYIDWIDPDGSGPQPSTLDSRRLSADAVDTVLARWTAASGAVAWYLTDNLGSVRDVANNSGTVLDHINYDSFGQIRSESNPSNGDRFKFTGYEHDSETGLYQVRARSFDPTTGRFDSSDPISFSASDSNLYRYAGNQPTTRVDRTGLESTDDDWRDDPYLGQFYNPDASAYPGLWPDFDYGAWSAANGCASAACSGGAAIPRPQTFWERYFPNGITASFGVQAAFQFTPLAYIGGQASFNVYYGYHPTYGWTSAVGPSFGFNPGLGVYFGAGAVGGLYDNGDAGTVGNGSYIGAGVNTPGPGVEFVTGPIPDEDDPEAEGYAGVQVSFGPGAVGGVYVGPGYSVDLNQFLYPLWSWLFGTNPR